jgi:hypothetical protein
MSWPGFPISFIYEEEQHPALQRNTPNPWQQSAFRKAHGKPPIAKVALCN